MSFKARKIVVVYEGVDPDVLKSRLWKVFDVLIRDEVLGRSKGSNGRAKRAAKRIRPPKTGSV